MINPQLIRKYNVPGPRYTSYPTVPFWDTKKLEINEWKEKVRQSYTASKTQGISIYIHLPFCESLCTFCGCHKRITKRFSVQDEYTDTLLKEWDLYLQVLGSTPLIKEIHLGGGTPTFFSPTNLKKLIDGILEKSTIAPQHEFSFEGHPNNTSKAHLQTLYDIGFRRNSFGVQDYDAVVQKAINRIQPFENVQRVNEWSKEIGYTSISHDLVFGLPHQTTESVRNTIELTNQLKPDRIAFYSYAHVPWIKGLGQRGYNEKDLPSATVKKEMYELGKMLFDKNEYIEIGMDHFALKTDSMNIAMKERKLHRNFMGYTTNNTQLMIGLGMSSISDSWDAFAQNSKTVEEYTTQVNAGEIPIMRGHLLTPEDLHVRKHILELMCDFETNWEEDSFNVFKDNKAKLQTFIADELLLLNNSTIKITPKGRAFVRNICMCFDVKLLRNKPTTRIFSQTI